MSAESHGHEDHSRHYVKIWGILLVLLIVSICGPLAGIRVVTLLTAFGIAIVKAIMVAREFMHLKLEKRYMSYMIITMLLLVFLFFFAVAPDVMTPGGENWLRIPIHDRVASHGEHE